MRAAAILLCLCLCLCLQSAAYAKATKDVPYSVAECFSSALRFVRIDRGCQIVDKDADAAFLTWECKDGEKSLRGALEIFRATTSDHPRGGERTRLQVTLGDDPHYVEIRFLELLERKLREERGAPPELAPPPAKKPSPDGGT